MNLPVYQAFGALVFGMQLFHTGGGHMLFLLLTLLSPLQAQFTSLATDFTGDTLYFTAYQQQVGTDQPSYGKLFVADDAGVRPLVIRDRQVMPLNNGLQTNPYDMVGVDVASNGAYIAITGSRECTLTRVICRYAEYSDIFDNQGRFVRTEPGFVSFSANGEWMLVVAANGTPFADVAVVQLATGERRAISNIRALYSRIRQFKVANDGSVALPSALGDGAKAAVSDASGELIIVEEGRFNAGAEGFAVWRTRVGEGGTKLTPDGRVDWFPRLSDDGSLVLLVSRGRTDDNPQIYVMSPDGGGRRQVTQIPEGARSAVLSGNGTVAWIVTRTGRLLKVDIASGSQQERIGPSIAFYWPVRCGLNAPFAWGAAFTIPASVMPGDAVEIRCGDRQTTVTEVGVQRVSFQFDAEEGRPTCSASLRKTGSDGPWISTRGIALTLDAINSGETSCGDPGLR